MNLLMLSGNSLKNRDWIEEASTKLPDTIATRVIQYYQHWENGGEWIHLDDEELSLKRQQLERVEPYGIFAKSIGTVLALQAIEEKIVKPQFLILFGVPLNYVRDHYPEMKDILLKLKVPLTIIHNKHDTVGTSRELKSYLGENTIRIIEPDESNHEYQNYDLISVELQRLIELAE